MDMDIVLTLAGIALTAALAYLGAAKGTAAKLAALETKLDLLNARVEKHNGFGERIPVLEAQVSDLRSDTDEIFVRLRKLETSGIDLKIGGTD